MTPRDVSFAARDGYPLVGSLFEPEGTSRGRVLITAGTGFKARYYRPLAEALAKRGFSAFIFDCRGIGRSAPEELSELSMRYWDWGRNDMPAALDALLQHTDGGPVLHIGHSVGGHFVGFWDNQQKVDAHAFVCVGSGSLFTRPVWRNPLELLFWHVIGPLSLRQHGYVKTGKMWTGASLPRGVFEDWKRWCHRRRYFHDDLESHLRPHHFGAVTAPITSFLYTDDAVATPFSSRSVLAAYPNAPIDYRIAKPSDFGLKAIGHWGPFSDRHDPARQELISWCEAQVPA